MRRQSVSDMETKLENIQQQIDYKQQSLDNLLELRQKFVIEAYQNGMSMIKIGELLKITRQRVYAITKAEEE
jgi:DNA-directed RNA polymerase specialized sigma subunit